MTYFLIYSENCRKNESDNVSGYRSDLLGASDQASQRTLQTGDILRVPLLSGLLD